MSRNFIVLGDTTTHGGTVITAWGEGRWTIDGKPVACVGDKVICPATDPRQYRRHRRTSFCHQTGQDDHLKITIATSHSIPLA